MDEITNYLGLEYGKHGYAAYQEVKESEHPGACSAMKFVNYAQELIGVIAHLNTRAHLYNGRIHIAQVPYGGCAYGEKICVSIVLEELPFDFMGYKRLIATGTAPHKAAKMSSGDINKKDKNKK
jgi:hypothetical protein